MRCNFALGPLSHRSAMWHDIATSQDIKHTCEKLQKLLAASARASASHSAMTSLTIEWITSAEIQSKVCQCCFKISVIYCQVSRTDRQWSWKKSRMLHSTACSPLWLCFRSPRPFWPILGQGLSWCVSWRRCRPISGKRLAANGSLWQSQDKLPQSIWKLTWTNRIINSSMYFLHVPTKWSWAYCVSR